MIKYAFLIKGYKKKKYYWETVVFVRKVLLMAVAVLYSEQAEARSLICLVVIFAAFVAHAKFAPFEGVNGRPLFDAVEALSLFTSFTIFFCGAFTRMPNITRDQRLFADVAPVVVNVAFIVAIVGVAVYLQLDKRKAAKNDARAGVNRDMTVAEDGGGVEMAPLGASELEQAQAQIAQLIGQSADRDQVIADKDRQLADKDQIIAHLQAQKTGGAHANPPSHTPPPPGPPPPSELHRKASQW